MRSLVKFYIVAIIIPFIILFFLAFYDLNMIFVITLVFYAFVYRPIIDGNRLIKKGLIEKREIWKLLIFYGHIKYFKELYLEK